MSPRKAPGITFPIRVSTVASTCELCAPLVPGPPVYEVRSEVRAGSSVRTRHIAHLCERCLAALGDAASQLVAELQHERHLDDLEHEQ